MLQRHLSESEGRAWPGSLPQHVFSTCHSGLWYDVSPLRYWKSRVPWKIWWICLLPRSTIRHPGINSSRGCDSRRECSSGAVWKKTKSLDSLGYRRYYMKTWQPVVNRDSPRTSPRHPQQPDTTALGSFYRSNSGSVLVTGCSLKTGAGSLAVTRWFPWPMTTSPESLLKMIRCNCATGCASARCSCRKHGLDCSSAYGQCRGTACTNISAVLGDNDDEEDE